MDYTILKCDYLEHYGVEGMRWGVRKNRTRKPSRKKAAVMAKKMSDEDLRKKINRMNLESQYVDVVAGRKNGQNFVMSTIKKSAGIILAGYSTKYMKKGVEYLAKEFMDPDILAVLTK